MADNDKHKQAVSQRGGFVSSKKREIEEINPSNLRARD